MLKTDDITSCSMALFRVCSFAEGV